MPQKTEAVKKAEDGRDESKCTRSQQGATARLTVLSVADEVVLLVRFADVGDRELVVHDRCRDEAGDDGSVDLDGEGVALADLHIVSELEVLGESDRVHAGDDTERLEEVHRERVLRVD